MIVLSLLAQSAAGAAGAVVHQGADVVSGINVIRVTDDRAGRAGYLPDRIEDARVAAIAFRIAVAGVARCPRPDVAIGLALQFPAQFQPADRRAVIAAYTLDRGPGITLVVPRSPAAIADLRAGDVLVAIDGEPVDVDTDLTRRFDAARARREADSVVDRIAPPDSRSVSLTLWRDGRTVSTRLSPVPACPSRVHLARSDQRNAYADGRYVFVTTGLVRRTRNDDEVAFVVAHEMAHNILGHATAMREAGVRRGLGRSFGRSGRIVRGTEEAADLLGGALMLDAGFDPVLGAAILKRLGGRELGIGLFDVHASPDARIVAMRALADERRPR